MTTSASAMKVGEEEIPHSICKHINRLLPPALTVHPFSIFLQDILVRIAHSLTLASMSLAYMMARVGC